MKRICIITTLWSSINNWILPFLGEYHKRDIEVTVVCNMSKEFGLTLEEKFPYVNTHAVDFPRGINLWGSLRSVLHLISFLRREKFDMVQYSTPNASMYAALASFLVRVPVRLYCQWGMVYVTMKGIKRKVFETIERIVCACSTEIQPDSEGNLNFCRAAGLYGASKSHVIWKGSAKGLDLSAFDIEKKDNYASAIKVEHHIPADAPIIGFVGRLGREKGCNELFLAFQTIKKEFPSAKLLFVGPIEKEESIEPTLLEYFYECDDIIKTGRVSNVEQYTAAMDVFVLPSYREGFGMSVVEASAMEVPVVVTQYPGPSSAMLEGETGFAVPVGNVDQLTERITYLLRVPELAKQMGKKGRHFVRENFDQKVFIEKYMQNRLELLSTAKGDGR